MPHLRNTFDHSLECARPLKAVTCACVFGILSTMGSLCVQAGTPSESDQGTALVDAAEVNDGNKALALLNSEVDLNAQHADGMTALHWAAYHQNAPLVTSLLRRGADPNIANRYGFEPLYLACLNGDSAVAKLLVDSGADVNCQSAGGETALMTASRTGEVEVMRTLIDQGAAIDATDRAGQTAIMWAAAEGNLDAVNLLMQANAEFQNPLASGFTPLFFAVREGHTHVALRLIDEGIDIDQQMQPRSKGRGLNPLLLAVENGHFETALALVQAGADPNEQPRGFGALHAVSWVRKPIRGDGNPSPVGSGNVNGIEFVARMVAAGADVNLPLRRGSSGFAAFNMTGSTPFVLAARTGDIALMEKLLELGANPEIPNKVGTTALLAAAGVGDLGSGQQSAGTEQEAINAIRLLLEYGADINAVDDNGETAIHAAAYQNWPKLIGFLVDRGCEVDTWNRENKWGWTPLQIARGYRKGNFRPDVPTIEAITQALRKSGVEPTERTPTGASNQQSWDKKPKAKDSKKTNQG